MILPPDTPPPGTPGSPADSVPVPGTAWDGDAALAGLDPDTVGLDLDALADRDEPTDAELSGEYPPEDDDAGGWVTGVVLAGPGEAFAEGGPLGQMPPDGTLAGLSGCAFGGGLGVLSDDALVGLLHASRRVSAWQSGIELAAVAELDHRRLTESGRPGWSQVSEHIAAELAAALVLTGRSADLLLGLARDLARLPAVLRALLAGEIDRARAAVFAAELAALGDRAANAAAGVVLPGAAAMTTGQLRAALRTLVLSIDPAAVRRRMTRARSDGRVETWQEGSGNLALAGRELDPADAAAADRRITAIAQALKDAGSAGTLDELRAAVFTALLAGHHPDTLLPATEPAATGGNPGPSGDGRPPPGPAGPRPAGRAGQGSSGPVPGGAGTGWLPSTGTGGLAALTGTIHLTLPASTWLGLTDLPGDAAGLGPLDAWTSRDLAARLAAGPGTRWHVTRLRPDGAAAAHATTRAGPGPGDPAACRAWLARLRYTPVEGGPCAHGCQTRPTGPPPRPATWSGPGTRPAPSPAAEDQPPPVTSTTRSPGTRAARRAPAIWHLCADDTTGPNRHPAGPSPNQNQAP